MNFIVLVGIKDLLNKPQVVVTVATPACVNNKNKQRKRQNYHYVVCTNTYAFWLPTNRVAFLQTKGVICDHLEIKRIMKLRENFHFEVHHNMKYVCRNMRTYARLFEIKYLSEEYNVAIIDFYDFMCNNYVLQITRLL